jgi:DNA repair protein RadD
MLWRKSGHRLPLPRLSKYRSSSSTSKRPQKFSAFLSELCGIGGGAAKALRFTSSAPLSDTSSANSSNTPAVAGALRPARPPEMASPAWQGGAAQGVDEGGLVATKCSIAAPSPQVLLRPYQIDLIERIEQITASTARRVLMVAPTGAGKTVIAVALIRLAVARGERVLVLVHRRELVQQTVRKLYEQGIDAGIIQAGITPRPEQPVQVASIQTLWARAYRGTRMKKPPADLVVVDEAHHVRARTWMGILDSYQNATILGMTATPCRGDGRGLGDVFEELVQCPQIESLIGLGYLVRTKVYAPSTPDLTGVRVERGDYVESQLAERMDQAKLVGDIVEHWHRLADRRKTVVFATGVAHSIHIRDEFLRSGVLAEHIDGKTPAEERDAILARLSRGETEVVCNCMVLTEGWDQPDVSSIVLARPTKHMGLYRQMIGRVLRPAPGKDYALVLDHAGATWQHGLVEEPVIWTLDQDRRAENPVQTARSQHAAPALAACPECSAIRTSGQPCPACGWRPTPRARAVEVADGDLAEFGSGGKNGWSPRDQQQFYQELLGYARRRGHRDGFAYYKFKEKFGVSPSRSWPRLPAEPSAATLSWVRSRAIAYAKARQRSA